MEKKYQIERETEKTTKIENKHKEEGGKISNDCFEKNVTPKAQHVNLIVSLQHKL